MGQPSDHFLTSHRFRSLEPPAHLLSTTDTWPSSGRECRMCPKAVFAIHGAISTRNSLRGMVQYLHGAGSKRISGSPQLTGDLALRIELSRAHGQRFGLLNWCLQHHVRRLFEVSLLWNFQAGAIMEIAIALQNTVGCQAT